MTRQASGHDTVRAWDFGDVLLEHYRYLPGPTGEIPAHAHPEYQMGIGDTPGEYRYRGAAHLLPPASLSMVHPDEMHSARDVVAREQPAEFWMFYFQPERLQRAAGRRTAPFFSQVVTLDRGLVRKFSLLPRQLIAASSQLARDVHLEAAVQHLLGFAGFGREKPAAARSQQLDRIRAAIEDDPAANPSLAELAAQAGLTPWQFCREFRARFGHPPHAYLLHARVRFAKRLLRQGGALADVAVRCGFIDQSHLTRHFRRLVDVTPGRYLNGAAMKNFS